MDQDQAPVHIFLNKQTRDWGEAPAEDQLIFCSIKAISSMGQAITSAANEHSKKLYNHGEGPLKAPTFTFNTLYTIKTLC